VVVSVSILPRLTDLVGRRGILIACCLIQLPLYFWMLVISELWEAYVIYLIFGLGFGGRVSMSFIFM
jgi:hypothetical protein